jgi:hypothetical protein
MRKLTNITAPEHRCSVGGCPAVLKSDDGKTLTIIGKSGDPRNLPEGVSVGDYEEINEISAEIVLSSLGVTELIEAAGQLVNNLKAYEKKGIRGLTMPGEPIEDWYTMPIGADKLFALRSALIKIKGGVS